MGGWGGASRRVAAVVLSASVAGFTGAARAQATEMDKDFLIAASEADMAEIQMSQLALQRSENAEVKAFANRMLVDHRTLEVRMKPFADAWNVTSATSLHPEHGDELKRLTGLTGVAFDREYMRAMAADHHRALEIFESEQRTTRDASFKAVVASEARVVAQHAGMADRLHAKLG